MKKIVTLTVLVIALALYPIAAAWADPTYHILSLQPEYSTYNMAPQSPGFVPLPFMAGWLLMDGSPTMVVNDDSSYGYAIEGSGTDWVRNTAVFSFPLTDYLRIYTWGDGTVNLFLTDNVTESVVSDNYLIPSGYGTVDISLEGTTLGGGFWVNALINGSSFSFEPTGGPGPVPEPATVISFLLGAMGFVVNKFKKIEDFIHTLTNMKG